MNLISSSVSDNANWCFNLGLGSYFYDLGVMFQYDSVLLGLGNVLFLSDLYLFLGSRKQHVC